MKTALVIQHLAFEDPGTLRDALENSGFEIRTLFAGDTLLNGIDPLEHDLWVVLGGPIGVYENADFPFLDTELALLKLRLSAQKPTLGICLGGQLIAAALGAQVYPGGNGKEIGWSPLLAGPEIEACPPLQRLLAEELTVLHWHGDTFELPPGAQWLAASRQYKHQAFSLGRHVLALQCHLEVTQSGLEHWYIGHRCELAQAGIEIKQLRRQTEKYCPLLQARAAEFWQEWLNSVFSLPLVS